MITIPVAAGELVDKITILRVKAERIVKNPGGRSRTTAGDVPIAA